MRRKLRSSKRIAESQVTNILENEEEETSVHLSIKVGTASASSCQLNLKTLQWTENKVFSVSKDQDFKLIETETFLSYVRKVQDNLSEEKPQDRNSQDENSSLLVSIPISLVDLKKHNNLDSGNPSLSKDLFLSESSEEEPIFSENPLPLSNLVVDTFDPYNGITNESKTREEPLKNQDSFCRGLFPASVRDKTIETASHRYFDNNPELERMCQINSLTINESSNHNSDSTVLLEGNYDYIDDFFEEQNFNDNTFKESETIEFPKIVEEPLTKPKGTLESKVLCEFFKQYDENFQEEIVSEHSSETSHISEEGVVPIDSEILDYEPDKIRSCCVRDNFDFDKCGSKGVKGVCEIVKNEDLAIGGQIKCLNVSKLDSSTITNCKTDYETEQLRELSLKVNENIICHRDNTAFIRPDDFLKIVELDFEPDVEENKNFLVFSTERSKECESLTTQIPDKYDVSNKSDVTNSNSPVKNLSNITENKCTPNRSFSEAFTNSFVDDLLNNGELDFEPDVEEDNSFPVFSTERSKECESLTTQIPDKCDKSNKDDVTNTNSPVKNPSNITEKKCTLNRSFSKAFTNSSVDDLLNGELDFEPDVEEYKNFSDFSTERSKECESLTTQIPDKCDESNKDYVINTNSPVKNPSNITEKKCTPNRSFSKAFTNPPVENLSSKSVTVRKSTPTRSPCETVPFKRVCARKSPNKNNKADSPLKNISSLKDQKAKSKTKVNWDKDVVLKSLNKMVKRKLTPANSDVKEALIRVPDATTSYDRGSSDELELQPSISDLLDEEFFSSPIRNSKETGSLDKFVAQCQENENHMLNSCKPDEPVKVVACSSHKAVIPDEVPSHAANSHKADESDKVPSHAANSHKADESDKVPSHAANSHKADEPVKDLMSVVILLTSKGLFKKALDKIKKALNSNHPIIGNALYHVIFNSSKKRLSEIFTQAVEVYVKLPDNVPISIEFHGTIMNKIVRSVKESKDVSKSMRKCLKEVFLFANRNNIKLSRQSCYTILEFYFTARPLDWRLILDVLHFSVGICKNRPSFKHLNALLEVSPSIPQNCNSIVKLLKKIDASSLSLLKKDSLRLLHDTLVHYRNDSSEYVSDLICNNYQVFPETQTEDQGSELKVESGFRFPTQQLPSLNNQEFVPHSLQNIFQNFPIERWIDVAILFSDYGIEREDYKIIQNLHNGLKNCEERAGFCYTKLLNAMVWRPFGSEVFNSQITFLGQIGVSLMFDLHKENYYFSAVEVLESMHSYNINYYTLQKVINFSKLLQFGYFQVSMLKTANQIALVAVDICVKIGNPRNAIQVFSDCNWVPISKDDVAAITDQEEGQKGGILVNLLKLIVNVICSSSNPLENNQLCIQGVQVVEELLKMVINNKKSFLKIYDDWEDFVDRFFIILLNSELLNECKRLLTFIRKFATSCVDLTASSLRGFLVLGKRKGENVNSFFEDLTLEGIYIQSNISTKTILVKSYLTVEELQTAIEQNLLKFKNFVLSSSHATFEEKYNLKIKIELWTSENQEKVEFLRTVSSGLLECYSRIAHVLASFSPPIEICEYESSKLLDKSMIILRPSSVHKYMCDNFQLSDNSILGSAMLSTNPMANMNQNFCRTVSNMYKRNLSSVRAVQSENSKFSNIFENKKRKYVSVDKNRKYVSKGTPNASDRHPQIVQQETKANFKLSVVSDAVTLKIEQFLSVQIKKSNKLSNPKDLAQVFIKQVTSKLQISELVLTPLILRELNKFSKTI